MKQTYKRKPPFILISSALLIIAFTTISLANYYVANRSLNQHIETNTLPLTSDNIYSEVQRDLLQPILVSSLMAQDTFVHDWIDAGEKQPEQMSRYLKAIQDRYNAITAFFVSEQTANYYHSTGIIKQISSSDAADDWYFATRHSTMNSISTWTRVLLIPLPQTCSSIIRSKITKTGFWGLSASDSRQQPLRG